MGLKYHFEKHFIAFKSQFRICRFDQPHHIKFDTSTHFPSREDVKYHSPTPNPTE